MYIRMLSAVLLSTLLTATVFSQAKDSPTKDAPKGPDKIDGKTLQEWWKVATTDNDASIREKAIRVVASFDPAEVRKGYGKKLVERMSSGQEKDAGVRLVVMTLVGDIGIDDPADAKEATRILTQSAIDGASILRLTAIQTLGKFGHRAYGHVNELASSAGVLEDSSYYIRQAVARTLGLIGMSETNGPNAHAIKVLAGKLATDKCSVVRETAIQSIILLGPPWAAPIKAGSKDPPELDDKAAQETIDIMKGRVGGKKSATASETEKQIELMCRLVIIRFGLGRELEEQMNGIAALLSDPDPAVKIQALRILSVLVENAAPKIPDVVKLLEPTGLPENSAAFRSRQLVRAEALGTLGAIGPKAIDPILRTINNPKEYLEIRIAALDALGKLGEKAEPGREALLTIIKDPANIKGEGVSLLTHALTTLAKIGFNAQSTIPELTDLKLRLDKARDERLNSPEYKKFIDSPELKAMLARMSDEEHKKFFENPEDQFKKGVEETIRYIKESTPGHPGGEHKKP